MHKKQGSKSKMSTTNIIATLIYLTTIAVIVIFWAHNSASQWGIT